MILILQLLGCMPVTEGTWVGNPTGSLTPEVAPTEGLGPASGQARFDLPRIRSCSGWEWVDLEDVSVDFARGRATTGLELPAGRWCAFEASLALSLDVEGAGPIHLELTGVPLRVGTELAVEPEGTYDLFLGREDWLTPLVALSTQGIVDTEEVPGLDDVLSTVLASGSAIGDAEGPITPPPEPEPVAPIIQDCATDAGYEVDSFHSPRRADVPSVWMVGVYETHSNHGNGVHPMGEASLTVLAPGRHVLVVSSYEPVTWQLDVGPDSTVEEILLFGHHEQLVEGAGDIPVTFVDGPSCGYSWPYDGEGCDTNQLVTAVEAQLGQDVNHYEGCYRATDFRFATAAPEPSPEDPLVDLDLYPDEGAACEPGQIVSMSYPIPAEAMSTGASDPSGPGWCVGEVQFFDDPTPRVAGRWDYETSELVQIAYNGFSASEGCDTVHCGDLVHATGAVSEGMCSLYAHCVDGTAHTTGWTW